MATGGFLRAGILLLFLGQACLFLPCSAQDAAAADNARVDVVLIASAGTRDPRLQSLAYHRGPAAAGAADDDAFGGLAHPTVAAPGAASDCAPCMA